MFLCTCSQICKTQVKGRPSKIWINFFNLQSTMYFHPHGDSMREVDRKWEKRGLGEKGWEMVEKGVVSTSLSSSSQERRVVVHRVYYSTIMSFHQIRSRERAKYMTIIHHKKVSWFDRFTTERIRTKTFHWLSVLFTSFARIETDGQIHARCISKLFLEKKSQNNEIFL